MKEQTLMMITDISGYTRFLSRVGHTEGLKRAQDLLQIIINSNTLGLKLCEIEGDAVFFYAMGSLPARKDLLRQINRTYNAFEHYTTTNNLEELGIKFFVHTGECEEVRIGGRTKLYGMDVIKIHRLLKSITNKNDYLLVTKEAGSLLGFEPEVSGYAASEFPYIGNVEYILFNTHYFEHAEEPKTSRLRMVFNIVAEALSPVMSEFAGMYRRYGSMLTPAQ